MHRSLSGAAKPQVQQRGVVMKVIPDDTMRGLELRKGSVDVVVNDLPPDIVYELENSKRLAVVRSPGQVFVEGELWQAHRTDGRDLVPGEHVKVESVDGLELTVR